jgi:hypothetical protein
VDDADVHRESKYRATLSNQTFAKQKYYRHKGNSNRRIAKLERMTQSTLETTK